MANLSLHNVKSVQVRGNTYEDFCTLKLDIETQSKYDDKPIWETIELYFDSQLARKSFIESISEAGIL